MILLTKAMCYAMLALEDIEQNGFTDATRVARKSVLPPEYVKDTLRHLAADGLLRGKRGKRGGYELDKDQISLYDLHSSLHEDFWLESMPFELKRFIDPRTQIAVDIIHDGLVNAMKRFIVTSKKEIKDGAPQDTETIEGAPRPGA